MKIDCEYEIRDDEYSELTEESDVYDEPSSSEVATDGGEGLSDPVEEGEAAAGEAPARSLTRDPKNPNMRWYVVHTYSGYEEKAKSSLLERVKGGAYEKQFGEVVVPTSVSESTTKAGKKRQVTKTQFPGYMLVQMELDDNTLMLVKDTPRITGFVGNQRNPRPLPDHEVLRYINPEAAAEFEAAKPVEDVLFEKGEGVKVIDGPFSNFDGVVDEVKPDKARLRVLVSIFGRETPVELAYNQVEKLN